METNTTMKTNEEKFEDLVQVALGQVEWDDCTDYATSDERGNLDSYVATGEATLRQSLFDAFFCSPDYEVLMDARYNEGGTDAECIDDILECFYTYLAEWKGKMEYESDEDWRERVAEEKAADAVRFAEATR